MLVLATNPVDVLTYVAQKESGLPAAKVIGTGTLIDSERLRAMLGERLRVDARSVHASVIGEHGDSSVVRVELGAGWRAFRWRDIRERSLGCRQREEMQKSVRDAGPAVARLKGNTCFAIGACVARITEAVLRDERSVLAVSTQVTGQYGLWDVALSTPSAVGRGGVEEVLELVLNAQEREDLEKSAGILKNAYAELERGPQE